jgi:hypothetical protein
MENHTGKGMDMVVVLVSAFSVVPMSAVNCIPDYQHFSHQATPSLTHKHVFSILDLITILNCITWGYIIILNINDITIEKINVMIIWNKMEMAGRWLIEKGEWGQRGRTACGEAKDPTARRVVGSDRLPADLTEPVWSCSCAQTHVWSEAKPLLAPEWNGWSREAEQIEHQSPLLNHKATC